jgi:hypothetical protein
LFRSFGEISDHDQICSGWKRESEKNRLIFFVFVDRSKRRLVKVDSDKGLAEDVAKKAIDI